MNLRTVDLRSDTVTKPTPEMYAAMQSAPLGDDVLGDDPTVLRLEALAASMVGKEAAVFVTSGTMGNQIAIASHCQRGDSLLAEENSHILYYELGGSAVIGGVVSWTLPSEMGIVDPEAVRKRILKQSDHTPGTSLLCIENSHNRAGGTVVPVKTMSAYRKIADELEFKIHLDGARVFNASTALGVDVREITSQVDSVTFCLSKGLRSPVGSILCGTQQFVDRARRWRKRLGGGMRQAGVLAACGIVSLEKSISRLQEDHRRARRLAEAIATIDGVSVDMAQVQTNIVMAHTADLADEWQDALEAQGIRCFSVDTHRLRFVVHADIDDEDIEWTANCIRKISETRSPSLLA
jgi:threonine aldolase